MSLPTFIFVAVAIPLMVLALVWLIAQSMRWMAARPQRRALLSVVLGLMFLALFFWEWNEAGRVTWGVALRIVIGITWLVMAAYEYRRGAAGDLGP